jgi:hypothetical protein
MKHNQISFYFINKLLFLIKTLIMNMKGYFEIDEAAREAVLEMCNDPKFEDANDKMEVEG